MNNDQINNEAVTKYEESATVELKNDLIEAVKKEMIAFLNTDGGTIFVGVEDDGTIAEAFASRNKDDLDTKLSNWIQEAFFPNPSTLISYGFNEDGVMVINVLEGDNKPYYLIDKGPKPSGVYKRVGSTTRKANSDEILSMVMQSRNYVFEKDVSDEQDLSFRQLKRIFDEKEMKLTERTMMNLGIINKNKRYTNLGLILSDQSDITVKLAEYDEQMNFKIKKTFSGCLVKILYDVEEQAERLNDTSAMIDGSTFTRSEKKSYPGASLREIILNAFCHADYFIRSNIKIEFFPDRAKITSPGGIFNATMDDIMQGVQTYRNPRLVRLFDKLDLIENFGTGIPRTFAAYENSGKKPLFEASDRYFFVTLPNLNHSESDQIIDQITDQITDQINDIGLLILREIKQNPGIKVPALTDRISDSVPDINADKIRNEIKRELRKYIERKGSKKTGGYYIKEE